MVSVGVIRVQCYSAFKFPLASCPVVVILIADHTECGMGFSQIVVKFQSFLIGSLCFRHYFVRGKEEIYAVGVHVCDAGVSGSEAGVQIDRLLEVFERLLRGLLTVLVLVVTSFEVGLVSSGIDLAGTRQANLLLWS